MFNLKILSICIGVAAIGVTSIYLTGNPKNAYPEYNTKNAVNTTVGATQEQSDKQFGLIVNSVCSSNSCGVQTNDGFSKNNVLKEFSTSDANKSLKGAGAVAVKVTAENGVVGSKNTDRYSYSAGEKQTPDADLKFATAIVHPSDTIISVCKRMGVDANDISSMIYDSGIRGSKFNLSIGQRVDVLLSQKHNLVEMRIHGKGALTYKAFVKKGGAFVCSEMDYPHSTQDIIKEFKYGGSFLKSAEGVGLTGAEAGGLFDKLNDRVDFKKLSNEAVVKVDLTQTVVNGIVSSYGINAVQILSANYKLTAIDFNGNLYDAAGDSLSPSFLSSPLRGKVRVTSHFSLSRMHPILHYRRPHWGTDYGCPIGTPIIAISDAKVIRSGKVHGFGNMVMLKHPDHIETIAAHMIRVAKGIHVGAYVKKGQVIGYVGKTGLSTGPHLHFEMRVNGKRVDNLKVKLPVMGNVSNNKVFELKRSEFLEKLNNL